MNDLIRLRDRATGLFYRLGLSDGVLYIEPAADGPETDIRLRDEKTGLIYKLILENVRLNIMEVT